MAEISACSTSSTRVLAVETSTRPTVRRSAIYNLRQGEVDVSSAAKHDMGFWHRNIDAHEIIFCVKGGAEVGDRDGVKIMHPGDMLLSRRASAIAPCCARIPPTTNVLIELKIADELTYVGKTRSKGSVQLSDLVIADIDWLSPSIPSAASSRDAAIACRRQDRGGRQVAEIAKGYAGQDGPSAAGTRWRHQASSTVICILFQLSVACRRGQRPVFLFDRMFPTRRWQVDEERDNPHAGVPCRHHPSTEDPDVVAGVMTVRGIAQGVASARRRPERRRRRDTSVEQERLALASSAKPREELETRNADDSRRKPGVANRVPAADGVLPA